MGFLDEVKRNRTPAAAVTAAAEPLPGVRPHRAVAEALSMLQDGLGAFARRLNAAMPEIWASYRLASYGTIKGLRQGEYRLQAEPSSAMFNFSCLCRGRESLQFAVETREVCDRLLDLCIEAGLLVKYRSHADWKFLFTVKPVVPVELSFQPHGAEPTIQLVTKNLDVIGTRHERIDPAKVDEEFLFQLEQCVLRKPNHFDSLLGNRLSAEQRARLRAQVEERRRVREAEIGVAERLKRLVRRSGSRR